MCFFPRLSNMILTRKNSFDSLAVCCKAQSAQQMLKAQKTVARRRRSGDRETMRVRRLTVLYCSCVRQPRLVLSAAPCTDSEAPDRDGLEPLFEELPGAPVTDTSVPRARRRSCSLSGKLSLPVGGGNLVVFLRLVSFGFCVLCHFRKSEWRISLNSTPPSFLGSTKSQQEKKPKGAPLGFRV